MTVPKILKKTKIYMIIFYSNKSNKEEKELSLRIKIGLDKCNGEYIVFQDADLEYDPHDLLKFEDVFLKFKADGIIGSRFNYDKYTRSHSILNKIVSNLIRFFNFYI